MFAKNQIKKIIIILKIEKYKSLKYNSMFLLLMLTLSIFLNGGFSIPIADELAKTNIVERFTKLTNFQCVKLNDFDRNEIESSDGDKIKRHVGSMIYAGKRKRRSVCNISR